LISKNSPNIERTFTGQGAVRDQPTLQAIRLVRQSEPIRLTSADYRVLKGLADQASEDSLRKVWPQIWGEFVQHFDPR